MSKKESANSCYKRSSIGGQAVMEGVMMRGPSVSATAVRNPDGDIVVQSTRFIPLAQKSVFFRLPFVRGVVSFISSMVLGTKTLMNSAEVFGDVESEPTKFDKWLEKKTKIDAMDIAMWIGLILGLGLSILLFFILPTLILSGLQRLFGWDNMHYIVYNLIEGGIRIGIFVAYVSLVSLMKDIRRVFMYHGAEHKVISCYEHGMELTVENAQKMTTVHARCGTTFMVLVMVVAILVFSLFGKQDNVLIRVAIRLAMLPVVAGISYELLKLFAISDNFVCRFFRAPGLLLQKLTTKQPTDDMVEVAIRAFVTVQEMEADASIKAVPAFPKSFKTYYSAMRSRAESAGIDEADVDWILCEVMNVSRSELKLQRTITAEQISAADEMFSRREAEEPVQYIIGSTEFYGYRFTVDRRALIPRMDSECVAEQAIKAVKEIKNLTPEPAVLDMCTGSGVLGITVAKECDVPVTLTDISKDALALAQLNAEYLGVTVTPKLSDMFEDLSGKYDVIVCNPPYVTTAEYEQLDSIVKDNEPTGALLGGPDGLNYYRIIAEHIAEYLSAYGVLVLEIGSTQAESVTELLTPIFDSVEVFRDLSGLERGIVARGISTALHL